MPELEPFVDELPIPPVVHPLPGTFQDSHLTIAAVPRTVHLHQQLPATHVWSYRLEHGLVVRPGRGETFLGPTVVVTANDTVRVDWKNEIPADATIPFEVVKVVYQIPDPDNPPPFPENSPGTEGALSDMEDMMRAPLRGLHAALVTHLHGGRTQADSDGWPDNTTVSGQFARYIYHNRQAATMLWYHDHAIHATRLNVYAGLAGTWLIRDAAEAALNLPHGAHELPLIIQDRNLALDDQGNFSGALLHKTETRDGAAEFFGPYTLVNGKIWPKASVEARLYRLRILNGANARTFRLLFLDQSGKSVGPEIVRQIGGDQGLMNTVPEVPIDGWRLGSSERLDLLIDFSNHHGRSIYLWNTAEAPFGEDPTANPSPDQAAAELASLVSIPPQPPAPKQTLNARRPFPQVMRFDVGESASRSALPAINAQLLATPRPAPEINANTQVRIALLVEVPVPEPVDSAPLDATSMLVFWECVPTTASPAPAGSFQIKYWHPGKNDFVEETFIKGAAEFYDPINWRVHLDATELWYFINVSPDTHPIHVHLVDMIVLQRLNFTLEKTPPDPAKPLELDPNPGMETLIRIDSASVSDSPKIEPIMTGPKDTVRVNPGEMIGVAMKFGPFPGRFMYHCHILEHEDHDMMRPFVIVPKWLPHHHN